MAEHVLQFNDGGADWCINCGQFVEYLPPQCEGGNGAYDCRTPANRIRVFVEVFGAEVVNDA